MTFLFRTVLCSILKDCGKFALFSFPMAPFLKNIPGLFCIMSVLVKNSFIIQNSSFALYFIE